MCDRTEGLDRHHLLSGTANRKLAEEDGLWIWLCREHHKEAHEDVVCNDMYKRLGQIYYEQAHTRAEFIKRYGKSFFRGGTDERVQAK